MFKQTQIEAYKKGPHTHSQTVSLYIKSEGVFRSFFFLIHYSSNCVLWKSIPGRLFQQVIQHHA